MGEHFYPEYTSFLLSSRTHSAYHKRNKTPWTQGLLLDLSSVPFNTSFSHEGQPAHSVAKTPDLLVERIAVDLPGQCFSNWIWRLQGSHRPFLGRPMACLTTISVSSFCFHASSFQLSISWGFSSCLSLKGVYWACLSHVIKRNQQCWRQTPYV